MPEKTLLEEQFDACFAQKTTDDLAQGEINKYTGAVIIEALEDDPSEEPVIGQMWLRTDL